MTTRRSPEPLLWLLFSAGGMVAALLVPVLLFLFGIAFPLDWLTAPDYAHLLARKPFRPLAEVKARINAIARTGIPEVNAMTEGFLDRG